MAVDSEEWELVATWRWVQQEKGRSMMAAVPFRLLEVVGGLRVSLRSWGWARRQVVLGEGRWIGELLRLGQRLCV